MSIVTKKGDGGFTSIPHETGFSGKNEKGSRIRKDHSYIEYLGELDELDAFLALCEVMLQSNGNSHFSGMIKKAREELCSADKQLNTELIELCIAELEKENPVNDFIRTWTKTTSATINCARTICRRCERRMVSALSGVSETEDFSGARQKNLLPWLNRLSDLLFLLAASEEKNSRM